MKNTKDRYFIINKPYNMVSQFISPHKVGLLSDLEFIFPEGTHAIGRLDNHSEGLLLLTTNKKVTKLLFQDRVPHKRVYLVQVKNVISDESLRLLREGVTIRIKGDLQYCTPPCEVAIVENPETIIKNLHYFKAFGIHTWFLITLTEGKYHQVRKMFAAVKHRVKRLIRVAIEDLILGDLNTGEVKEIEETEVFRLLKL